MPVGDRAAFQAWSNDIVAFFGSGTADIEVADASLSALAAARELLTPIIDDRRRHPADDLISGLVHAEVDGGRLTEREIVATSVTLMTAGHETTTTLISAGLLALLRNPDELRDLAANPSLIDGAIEELLRFDAPFSRLDAGRPSRSRLAAWRSPRVPWSRKWSAPRTGTRLATRIQTARYRAEEHPAPVVRPGDPLLRGRRTGPARRSHRPH